MNKIIFKSILVAALCVVLALVVAKASMEPATEETEETDQTEPTEQAELLPGGKLIELNEENWHLMLEGEWMVGIFAPWCQSCKEMAPVWERFARLAATVPVQVAKIEVNHAPALSGRFLVTYVPKIYHVKDGEFRLYRGAVYDAALLNYVQKGLWKGMQPLSPWLKPNAIHMSLLGYFAKVSHSLKEFKGRLQVDYGLTEFVAYMLVVSAIVIVGVSLGSMVMYLIDFVNGPKPLKKKRQNLKQIQGEQQRLVENVEILETEQTEEIEDGGNEQIQELGNSTYEQGFQAEEQLENETKNDTGEDKDEEQGSEQASYSSSQEKEADSELKQIKLVGNTTSGKAEKVIKNRNRESHHITI